MIVQQMQIHNLPPQPTPFIGREPEIAEIVDLLNDANCRLLTLSGPGGIGKTRLSIESINRLTVNNFEHGVFYVPLAPLTSADNIVTTVISVLGILIGDDGTSQEELVKFLSQRNLMLVMDNFEHVLDGADFVADILNSAPNVKILVISREALNLRIERVWHVRGMRYPDTEQIDNIEQYSALKLFIDRATWVRREFSPVDEQASVIRICQLIEGMPLAIELAASWLKTLSCQDIIQQIERGIDFLTTSVRVIPERHRSIRAVFDHSWSLLSADEQSVFPRLSVFHGGFTLEAAEKVADANLMTLSGLVEKSMVRPDATGRYDVHELLRQYAKEKLETDGGTDDTLSAHTAYFTDFMRKHAIDIKGRRQLEGLNEIEADWDNVVEAWYQAVDSVDYSALDHMMEGLLLFTEMRSRFQQGFEIFQLAINTLIASQTDDLNPVLNRLRIHWLNTWHMYDRRQISKSIYDYLMLSLTNARALGERDDEAWCLLIQGVFASFSEYSDESPATCFEAARVIFHENGNLYALARTLRQLSSSYIEPRYKQMFWTVNQEYIELTREIGDHTGMAHGFVYAGVVVEHEGDFAEVIRLTEEAHDIWYRSGDRKSIAFTLSFQAFRHLFAGHLNHAKQLAIQVKKILEEINYDARGLDLLVLGFIAVLEGRYHAGIQLANKAMPLSNFVYNNPLERIFCVAAVGLGELGKASEHLTAAYQYLANQFEPAEVIYWLPIASCVLAYDGMKEDSVELYGLAMSQSEDLVGWVAHWQLLQDTQKQLESELGSDVYQSLLDRGEQRDLKEMVAELLEYFSDGETSKPESQPLAEPLTKRELEVLELIADGLTNPQIAEKLYLSTGTVKVHTRNIYGKLNVSNRTEAVVVAQRLNLI